MFRISAGFERHHARSGRGARMCLARRAAAQPVCNIDEIAEGHGRVCILEGADDIPGPHQQVFSFCPDGGGEHGEAVPLGGFVCRLDERVTEFIRA